MKWKVPVALMFIAHLAYTVLILVLCVSIIFGIDRVVNPP